MPLGPFLSIPSFIIKKRIYICICVTPLRPFLPMVLMVIKSNLRTHSDHLIICCKYTYPFFSTPRNLSSNFHLI